MNIFEGFLACLLLFIVGISGFSCGVKYFNTVFSKRVKKTLKYTGIAFFSAGVVSTVVLLVQQNGYSTDWKSFIALVSLPVGFWVWAGSKICTNPHSCGFWVTVLWMKIVGVAILFLISF